MIIKIFASIGLIVTFILVVVLVESIWSLIGYVVSEHRYNKQLKSRFEGGPTAKCFCKDCKYYYEKIKDTKHDSSTGVCEAHNLWRVRDNWYCWSATPLDYDEAKRREENEKER